MNKIRLGLMKQAGQLPAAQECAQSGDMAEEAVRGPRGTYGIKSVEKECAAPRGELLLALALKA